MKVRRVIFTSVPIQQIEKELLSIILKELMQFAKVAMSNRLTARLKEVLTGTNIKKRKASLFKVLS